MSYADRPIDSMISKSRRNISSTTGSLVSFLEQSWGLDCDVHSRVPRLYLGIPLTIIRMPVIVLISQTIGFQMQEQVSTNIGTQRRSYKHLQFTFNGSE